MCRSRISPFLISNSLFVMVKPTATDPNIFFLSFSGVLVFLMVRFLMTNHFRLSVSVGQSWCSHLCHLLLTSVQYLLCSQMNLPLLLCCSFQLISNVVTVTLSGTSPQRQSHVTRDSYLPECEDHTPETSCSRH